MCTTNDRQIVQGIVPKHILALEIPQDSAVFDPAPEAMNFATSAQHVSLSASSSGISMENSSSIAITSSTLSKLSSDKSFWKSAVSVTYFNGQIILES